MDASLNGQGVNGTHQQQPHHGSSYGAFMDDIHSYTAPADTGTEDYQFSWDPALFATTSTNDNLGSPFTRPSTQQPAQHAGFNPAMARQPNNNPALPQFQHSQHSSSQYAQNSYPSHHFEQRTSSQPSFDDRFLTRPSNSPVPFEQYHHYQAPLHFNTQPYGHVQPSYQPQRQAPQPTPQYTQQPQRPSQQQSSQYMNIAPARTPMQTPQAQNHGGMFHQFQAKAPVQHSFVDPAIMTASNLTPMNGTNHGLQQRPAMQQMPFYNMAGPTIDPQMLQHAQAAKISPTPTPIQPALQPRPEAGFQGPQNGKWQSPSSSWTQAQPHPEHPGATGPPGPTAKDAESAMKPKPPASKSKKDVAAVAGADQASADELEIEDEPPEMTPAILCVSMPTDFRSKILYNIVQAVWSPRNKPATPEKVRSGVAAFGETVRSLRDAWKEKNESLKKAELPNSASAADVPGLKNDVAHFRSAMELAMQRSLQYGHDSIITRLGENQFTLSALYSFMLDRANAGDHDSSLVTNIFKFAIRFETLDEEMLETVKWTKILQRFTKKATNESKNLAKQILSNAAARSAKKRASRSDDGPSSPGAAGGIASASGLKRARDGETTLPVTKKIIRPASKPLALQHAERRKALEKENAAKAAIKSDKVDGKPVGSGAARAKVAMAAPLKTSAFAGLLSASKKPGTSLAEKKAAAKDKVKTDGTTAATGITTDDAPAPIKKDEGQRESPPRTTFSTAPKTASSFLGFLADMEKPKEAETKKAPESLDETAEQKEKRLRKEVRRKLRVTWKPDSDLVETRLFTHDPSEETGHADSMMRDAGDTMKEGEMLKLHKGVEDLDDDDDDETPVDLVPFDAPTEVDFSVIDSERAINFVKFGGPLKPTSPASEAQDKYEENTLMAIYTFKSDRPDTPKELPSVHEEDDDFSPSVDFGEPDEKVKRREAEIFAKRQPQASLPNTMDLAAQLRAMGQQQQQQQQQPQSSAQQSNPGAFDLQRTLSMLSQQNPPSSAASHTAPPAGGLDLAKLFAVVQQANQMQQSQPQPQPQPQPQYSTPPPAQARVPPNLAAIVAQLQQSQSLPLGAGSNPNPFPGNDAGRKHDRSDEYDTSGKRKKAKVPVGPDGKPLNYKTLVCSFYKEGKCIKGDNCTYRHDE